MIELKTFYRFHLVFLLLLFQTVSAAAAYKILVQDSVESDQTTGIPVTSIQEADSAICFIEQEFIYIAPLSGAVNLAWKAEKVSNEECLNWNPGTRIAYDMLYIPMEAKGDTFRLKIRIPEGTSLRYYFWISKNKEGHYQDFWDLQTSGALLATTAATIQKNANYSEKKKTNYSHTVAKGVKLLLLLLAFYLGLYFINKRWNQSNKQDSFVRNTFFLALSLIFFQALARSEIMGVNQLSLLYQPGSVFKVMKGSFSDLVFVFCLSGVFILLLNVFRSKRGKRIVFGLFVFLAVLSALAAFLNISTVAFFGKPFTYQWLYYSEFLGSNDARSAIQENLSGAMLLNLFALCVAVLVLARVLNELYRLLNFSRKIKYASYAILLSGLLLVSFKSYRTPESWTKGQSENAITAMVSSMLNAESNSSFFTVSLPDDSGGFREEYTEETAKVYQVEPGRITNVVYIILESAGSAYFDAYGGKFELSPNLNRYSRQAIRFDHMYAHAPVTDRSLVSILCSIYPFISYRSLTHDNPDLNFPSISSVLKTQGYRTSFFTSGDLRFQDCDKFVAHRGFDCVEDYSKISCSQEYKLDRSDYKEGNGIDDMCLADRLAAWLDEGQTDQNFFSLLWTVQGHYPYFFAQQEEQFGVSIHNMNRYLNCLKHNDAMIGQVMNVLEDRGLDSTTLVVVTGDHGEAFGQHKLYGHGSNLYEEFVRVPLYFINPGLFNGEQKNDIAGMKDLATTTLAILNLPVPEKWQGRNLLTTNSQEAFYVATLSDYLFAYRNGNRKYIFNESKNTVEVFDLENDPAEQINLFAPELKTEIANVRERVASWVQHQDRFIKEIRK